MAGLSVLIYEIANTLSRVSANDLPRIAESFGLSQGNTDESFKSKAKYIERRIAGWTEDQLVDLAKRVQQTYPDDSLQKQIEDFDPSQPFQLSPIVRQKLFESINNLPPIEGKLTLNEFTNKLWGDLSRRHSNYYFEDLFDSTENDAGKESTTFLDEVERYQLYDMSNQKLAELLEWAVHPLVRTESDQKHFVDAFNTDLKLDGYVLASSELISGFPTYRLSKIRTGFEGKAKNLIFASTGPKPEIVLSDAINNDLKLIKNEEFCLVYDKPFTKEGLLWTQLVNWYAELIEVEVTKAVEKSLYRRLNESLDSPIEILFFRSYFEIFHGKLGDQLPALIPQVYLHYDPYTFSQIHERRLPRQRMDFLILLSSYERVVIELDGKQHYSDGDIASPAKYADMVKADRDLRLLGYEVYRFGGAELSEENGKDVIEEFFTALFKKHNVKLLVSDAREDEKHPDLK
ncbi:hypothetical protein FYZ48_10970 [Gimesia chilikensis]|uniref:AbiJ-related protein n=1 Tax=Gimesia chilikensis TaxID=2605989 RepID=UPI0011EF781E|nr:hypothetical protein [Gimesia chilikensis]KAA0139156.1 hypothetical protein FYZ48_10970 [Gimesia chilikensis]